MKINVVQKIHTHEGARAKQINPELQLRRSVCACMLFEDTFYEEGETIAERILDVIPKVEPDKVAQLAVEARTKFKLRHVPLLIVRGMANRKSHRHLVAKTLEEIIQRPDELTEFLAIYWKDGRAPLSAQIKKGLARAFPKFDAYQLAKWDKPGSIRLRDVLFLCHAKPKDETQAELWKKLVDSSLPVPDTWEVSLSASKGKDKKEEWTRLISENKLGSLALLLNLRNMLNCSVDRSLIKNAISKMRTERVLPFRFIAAAQHAPSLEPELEAKLIESLKEKEKLKGETILLVDVSRSMSGPLSGKSKMDQQDAAAGVAMVAREICENVRVATFSNQVVEVPPRRGFGLRNAMRNSQPSGGTYIGAAVTWARKQSPDRIIVITDEQSHDGVPDPNAAAKGYVINVAPYRNGVGYGAWKHVNGFSESVLDYIREIENIEKESERSIS